MFPFSEVSDEVAPSVLFLSLQSLWYPCKRIGTRLGVGAGVDIPDDVKYVKIIDCEP